MTHRVLDLGVMKKLGNHQLSGGLIPTITYDVMEAFWGKRYLVRTAPDIQGIAARDVGLKLMGPLSFAEGLSYRVMYGAKATWEADKNPFNKVMGGITWRGSTGLLIDAYIDSESRPGGLTIDPPCSFWWVRKPNNTPSVWNISIRIEARIRI